MPLLDHFRPPVDQRFHWESFHSNWATRIADGLAAILPEEFQVEEHCHIGPSLEIDVAAFEQRGNPIKNGPAGQTHVLKTWSPPVARFAVPALFPDSFEVRVYSTLGGLTLVGVVELISPGNKDRPDERRAFAVKCAGFLQKGISLVMIDVVTTRRANLHNEVAALLDWGGDYEMTEDAGQYAVAYRPVEREGRAAIDIWPASFSVGDRLPVMPLRLTGEVFVPVDFEAAYQEACSRRRIM